MMYLLRGLNRCAPLSLARKPYEQARLVQHTPLQPTVQGAALRTGLYRPRTLLPAAYPGSILHIILDLILIIPIIS